MEAWDVDCRQRFPTVCQVVPSIAHSLHTVLHQDTASLFQLRGLCPSSTLDTVYKLKPALLNGRRQFSGPTGWLLHWTGAQWTIQNPRQAYFSILNVRSPPPGHKLPPPLGRRTATQWAQATGQWRLTVASPLGSSSSPSPPAVTPSLRVTPATVSGERRKNKRTQTVLSSSSMEQRCDQSSDCSDQSDEAGCMLVHVNPKQYLKVAICC